MNTTSEHFQGASVTNGDNSSGMAENNGPKTPEKSEGNKPVVAKRTDYITWPDYFMAIAFLSAQRSKDPSTQDHVTSQANHYRAKAGGKQFAEYSLHQQPVIALCLCRFLPFANLLNIPASSHITILGANHQGSMNTTSEHLQGASVTNGDNSSGMAENNGPKTPEKSEGNKPVVAKRTDYITWPDYFMAIAFLSAQRSKDPSTQVGACIVNEENKIVGIGYNGMPLGCNDDEMPWGREGETILDTKHAFVCHAEMNAIMNKNSADVKNCTIYVALFPCNECTKLIIQAGIKEVVYYSDKYHDRPEMAASRKMLDMAKINYRQHIPNKSTITIDFTTIDKCKPKSSGMRKLAFSP